MTDRYGPWTPHTPGECPVPPDTMVQVQLRQDSQIDAEKNDAVPADQLVWGDAANGTIAYYRVLLEPEWVTMTGCLSSKGTAHIGFEPMSADQFRIHWPMFDGKPDFSRQPKWEGV